MKLSSTCSELFISDCIPHFFHRRSLEMFPRLMIYKDRIEIDENLVSTHDLPTLQLCLKRQSICRNFFLRRNLHEVSPREKKFKTFHRSIKIN